MKNFKVSPNGREDQLFFAFRSVYRTASKPASYYNMRPPRMDTAQLSLVRQPFDHHDFLFELKHGWLPSTGAHLGWQLRTGVTSPEKVRSTPEKKTHKSHSGR
jgi:hypothetical protein